MTYAKLRQSCSVPRFAELLGAKPSNRATKQLFQVLFQRRMQQLLRLRRVEIRRRNQRHAGVDALLNRLASEVVDECSDAELAHAKGILHDDALQFSGAHRLHKDVAGVEADETDLPRFSGILEREERSGGR